MNKSYCRFSKSSVVVFIFFLNINIQDSFIVKGKISFSRAVALCATNPARIFGCANKGSLTVGKDADIVLYDPQKTVAISVDNMHSDYDHTIWEGKTLNGYPVATYVRGKLVYKDGEFVGEPGYGQFVKRVPTK